MPQPLPDDIKAASALAAEMADRECCYFCHGTLNELKECPVCDVAPPAHPPRLTLPEALKRVALLTSELETLRHALGVVLPMAKGYAAANPVGRNNQIVLWAECIALQHKAGV